MKTCYVSAPFGVKQGVDYDRLYREVIKPAAQSVGLECQRADELGFAAVIQKAIFQAVIGADVMIADVSYGNPNVLYEVGLRFGLRPGVTILMADADSQPPFSLASLYLLRYRLVEREMDVAEAERVRHALAEILRERMERKRADSPVYDLFPGLSVKAPPELASPEPGPPAPAASTGRRAEGQTTAQDLADDESELVARKGTGPEEYVSLLRE